MFVNFKEFYCQNIVDGEVPLLDDFCKKFTIKYSKPISLHDYFENNIGNTKDIRVSMRTALVNKLYIDFCTNKRATIEKFFNSYLSPKNSSVADLKRYFVYKNIFTCCGNLCIEEHKNCLCSKYISVQKQDTAKRLIRNLYYRELLQDTLISTSIPKKKTLLNCWNEAFNEYLLDDRYFSPSVIDHYMRGTPIHYFFQQYQPKASILNPYTVFWLLDFYFPHICQRTHSMYTPVLSWSAYALAFCFSQHWQMYHGTDVMPCVCQKTEFVFEQYNHMNKCYNIRNECSENIRSGCNIDDIDLVLTCPPYYKMEVYADNKSSQSVEKYGTYDEWLECYWRQTVDNCFDIMSESGIFAFIIGNYKDYKTRKVVDLVTDCNRAFVPEKWAPVDVIELGNRSSTLRKNSKTRSEYLFVYRKKSLSKTCPQHETASPPSIEI
jgi:hypothetical protein